MKKFIIAVLCLVVLAGAGFAAYRLDLLDQFIGTTTPGESPANIAASSPPSPGDAVANSSTSATGAPPVKRWAKLRDRFSA